RFCDHSSHEQPDPVRDPRSRQRARDGRRRDRPALQNHAARRLAASAHSAPRRSRENAPSRHKKAILIAPPRLRAVARLSPRLVEAALAALEARGGRGRTEKANQMNEKPDAREVRHEIYIEASPETVFALLTDATVMTKWQAETVDANPMRGGIFRL